MSKPGVAHVYYDNIGGGWCMACAGAECWYSTVACDHLADAAQEMEDHWADVHGGDEE